MAKGLEILNIDEFGNRFGSVDGGGCVTMMKMTTIDGKEEEEEAGNNGVRWRSNKLVSFPVQPN